MPSTPKNTVLLNDRSLKALRPGPERVDYMFADLEGFGIRVYPSGHRTFFVRYRRGRGFRRFTIGSYPRMTLAKARQEALTLLGRVASGDDPQRSKLQERAIPTVGIFAASYLEASKKRLKPGSYHKVQQAIHLDLLPSWKNRPITEIRRSDVIDLVDAIVDRGSPVQANRTLSIIHRLFVSAVESGLLEHNPASGVTRRAKERERERFLSEAEIHTLWETWAAERSIIACIFQFLLVTGQRSGEVLALRWSDIIGDWWTIPKEISKNGREHKVYLTKLAKGVLERLPAERGADSLVFPSPRSQDGVVSLNTAVKRYRKVSTIDNWSPHDLRRTVATYMGEVEVPDTIIGMVLNHKPTGITARYNRSRREKEISRTLQEWDRRLENIISGRSAQHQTPIQSWQGRENAPLHLLGTSPSGEPAQASVLETHPEATPFQEFSADRITCLSILDY